jgi:hypothetical protein
MWDYSTLSALEYLKKISSKRDVLVENSDSHKKGVAHY